MSGEVFPNNLTLSSEIMEPWGRLISCFAPLESIVLEKPSIKIGRGANCDITIDKNKIRANDTSISKVHCIITKDSDKFYISDMSKNGTYINGMKIGKNNKKIIKDNDEIAIVKDFPVYIFQPFSTEELPDTLTPDSTSESPMLTTEVVIPAWGRLLPCLLHLPSYDLINSVFKLGRSSQCDAVTDRMKINPSLKHRFSKEHFVICNSPETSLTCITDLSSCGTFLNGRLIGKNKVNILQHDDTIGIGPRNTRLYVYKSMLSSDNDYLPPGLRKRYEVSILLGKGGCGEVKLAYEKCSCKMYAIKKIIKGISTASQIHKLNHPNQIQTEMRILESLSHPCIIHMKEIVETPEEVFLVLEYMKGGELSNRILSNVPLPEWNVKFMFYQMVLAVQYLHSKGVAHRDLKPENVLLSSEEPKPIIKVSDFGLSKITEEEDMMRTMCGTLNYIAPEVLDIRIPEYDKQVDVWSLGVILFYMLSKQHPFKNSDKALLSKLIIKGIYSMEDSAWYRVSYLAKDLVTKMLTVDPKQRITICEILSHPWISEDADMQIQVKSKLDSQDNSSDTSEDFNNSFEVDPPSKRIKLSSSDEST